MFPLLVRLALLGALLTPALVDGQDTSSAGLYRAVCPVGRTLEPDTARLTLYLTAPTRIHQKSVSRKRQQVYRAYARVIGSLFVPPSSLTVPGPLGWDPGREKFGGAGLFPYLYARLALVVDSTRKASFVRLEHASGSRPLNEALLTAVHLADTAGLFQPTAPKDTARIELGAGQQIPDSALPVLRVRAPYFPVTEKVERDYRPTVDWPNLKKQSAVDLAFVVDALGRAIPATIDPLQEGDPEFLSVAVDVILRSTYHPARSGTCRVPMLVYQRIVWQWERMGVPPA